MIGRLLVLALLVCIMGAGDVIGQTVMNRTVLLGHLIPLPGNNDSKSVDLQIQFALNSSEILPQSGAQLRELVDALKSEELNGTEIEIVGHTDAVGSRQANARLAEARAFSVRTYLIGHDIDEKRLLAIGRGEDDLLPGLSATDPEQRRVEIIVKRRNPSQNDEKDGSKSKGFQSIN